ncbi:nucleoid-associated protein [Aestuariicella hydrocarbonica]|uniref:Nucleoid-associated protein n=1 Tax=Pseudomaricurvus hydrocarbonicus TaxID=1470433 RepID=A0A9E5MH17_9GAMM|nr:nucleoid-associated protein [Aestuariicella hydrocarbonica]NHO65406.1 nucleoid-associated protein [Aestuariicella hydrocarbonica]
MPLTHCIAHAIRRSGTEAPVEASLREQSLPATSYLEELVRELKHSYVGKAGKQYGQFDSDLSVSVVAQWLREFREERLSFERFTVKATEHFQSLLSDTDVVLDGHILFAIESLADADSLYVYLLLHNEGVYLDGDLSLQTSRFLDVRGVLLGAKVDMTAWRSEEGGSYLSVLRARGDKDLTDQFWRWIGFADQRDISSETTAFLDVVSAYSDTLKDEDVQVYRNKVVDYCLEQDKRGEPVVIRELSEHVDDAAPEKFEQFIRQSQGEATPAQLIPDRRQLKQYIRISGRNDLLSMSFAAECLGETIVYDREDDSLTIRNIPAPLKLRLIKHMQKLTEGE